MKKTLYQVLALIMLTLFFSCKKSENIEVDLSKFNTDDYVKGPIDTWLKTNLEDPYNISTVYRFERNLTDVNRDLSPVSVDKVQPMMNAVLVSFLQPFEKLAGKGFIKKYTPKQFVLYGSPSYNTNGSVTLGSADAGRTVILYELNSLNFASAGDVKRKIRTIHHEFTHILNQNIVIPPAFEQVSKADYYADWTSSANTAEISRDLGFISRYARSSFGEDFAEMVAHLLVEGQVFFENYLISASPAAAAKLREKEKLVYAYYRDYFGIDFKQLQTEVQSVLKGTYGATDPVDNTQSFAVLLKNNRIANLVYNPSASHYTTYGSSAAFSTVFNNFKAAIVSPRVLQNVQFIFTSGSTMTFRAEYVNGTSTLNADYNFSFTVNSATGEVIFSKVLPEGTGTTYSNGQSAAVLPAFEAHILPYLVNKVFVASWLPTGITPTNPLYRTFGGFHVNGTPANYFYGPITLK